MAVAQVSGATVGELLRFWRRKRRLSQEGLALDANVSTKHLSFLETGRARASRQLLVHLAETLQLPLRERNRLLLAAGFAPQYRDLPFDDGAMAPLRTALNKLLRAHQPNPALIVDAHWNLVAHNDAAELLWDGVDETLLEPPVNVLRLSCHPDGMPRISTITPVCNSGLVRRLRHRALDEADDGLLELLEEMEGYLAESRDETPPGWSSEGAMATFGVHTPLGLVRLFTTIATLGAPLEVTAASLAIETFLPADAESAARLSELSELTMQESPGPSTALGPDELRKPTRTNARGSKRGSNSEHLGTTRRSGNQ